MKDILWLMNYIGHQINNFPDYSLYSNYISTSHVSFYKHYILNQVIYNYEEQIILENMYFKSKKISNAIKKFCYHINIKKAIDSQLKQDLYFNELSSYPKNQKITLYIERENTTYNFRISNLISSWLDCLNKNEGLFIKPTKLKNPYTNIPFKKYNLYNIYFAIKNTSFNMEPIILAFFKSDFIITSFIYNNFPVLKDNAISCFIKHGSITELYEETHNMLTEFEHDIDYIILPHTATYRRKNFFVNELLDCLRYYCLHAFSCNPLLKRDAQKKCKEKLIDYFKNNDTTSFIRRRRERQQLLPPQILLPDTYTPVSLNDLISNISPTTPPTIYFDEEDLDVVSEIDDNSTEVQSIDSTENYINELILSDNPFAPIPLIPRTPTSNRITTPNTPFEMRLFR
jgi:hypothetical protein